MATEPQIAEIIARRISVSNATLRAAGDVICLNGIKEAAQEIAALAAAEQIHSGGLINLKAEWNRCSESYGHEPTYEQWHAWTLQLLRGERGPQASEQVRASEQHKPPGCVRPDEPRDGWNYCDRCGTRNDMPCPHRNDM